ncbi:MAG: hypothetical protein K6C08_08340 [Oscillospiraceae bacterium]|nr:hypothetical protein [Oscillospiraceae bacterium]
MNENNRLEYEVQRRAKAGTAATLRCLVAGYILYLAWQIAKGGASGNTSMSPALSYAAAAVFAAVAVFFIVYSLKRWRQEAEAARLPPERDQEQSGELLQTNEKTDLED